MDKTKTSPCFVASLTSDELSERAEARRATFASTTTSAGVCVADGFGVRVNVEHGALVVADGMGAQHRTRRYERATHGLRRLVVMRASAGFVTWEALSWCAALGIGVLVIDRDGRAELASTPRSTDDARLRRAQALAPAEPVGLAITRYLLSVKVRGQAGIVSKRFGDMSEGETISSLADAIEAAESIEEARQLEASAAALYFATWGSRVDTTPRFAPADRKRVPSHWCNFTGRRSVLASASANRKADRPTNALLNYVFALVEAEAILACQAVGLDPGLGVVHNDSKGRASLALDIMEPVRPLAEAFVLDLVGSRTFRKAEFTEAPDGAVRLLPPLSHRLAETLPRWSAAVAPVAEHVAHILGDALEGKFTAATPLTRDRAKTAQAVIMARKAQAQDRATRSRTTQLPGPASGQLALYTCTGCGTPVTNPRHTRCGACQDNDPRQAPAVRASRGLAISRARARDGALSGAGFTSAEGWPAVRAGLSSIGLSVIMARCGVSKSTAWSWKTGRTRPAPGHWRALAELGAVELQELGLHRQAGSVGRDLAPQRRVAP